MKAIIEIGGEVTVDLYEDEVKGLTDEEIKELAEDLGLQVYLEQGLYRVRKVTIHEGSD